MLATVSARSAPARDRTSTRALVGRDAVLERLDELVVGAARRGAACFVVGEAGTGKTAVLTELATRARGAGIEVLARTAAPGHADEPYAGLRPLLEAAGSRRRDAVPGPQGRALNAALAGNASGADRFLVASGCLSLLRAMSERAPVIVVVDDAHLLDAATAEVLMFVARRTEPYRVVLLLALDPQEPGPLADGGLPSATLGPLDDAASRRLLAQEAGDLDAVVRARILADAAGNPLALVELARLWRATIAGGSTAPPRRLTGRLRRSFGGGLDGLPVVTRTALLVAAVDDGDEVPEILAAAATLTTEPVGLDTLEPASQAGLLRYDATHVRFRHPLVRSAVVGAASREQLADAHRALAHLLADQPFRCAWHRGQAATGPDEQAATALEAHHSIALRQGSPDYAIWALERAAWLTADPRQRSRRFLLAAGYSCGLGHADLAEQFLTAAAREDLSPLDRARWALFRELCDDAAGTSSRRVRALSDAARLSAETGDVDLALDLLASAALRSWWADPGTRARAGIASIARVLGARWQGAGEDPRCVTALAAATPVTAAPLVQRVLARAADRPVDGETARRFAVAAHLIGDSRLAVRFVARGDPTLPAPSTGGLTAHLLAMLSLDLVEIGEWRRASAFVDASARRADQLGRPAWLAGPSAAGAVLAAMRTDLQRAEHLAQLAERAARGEPLNAVLACVQLARGLGSLAADEPRAAYRQLRRMFDPSDLAFHLTERYRGLAYLADAASRSGQVDDARRVLAALERETGGIRVSTLADQLAYARAVLAPDAEAERLFHAALAGDIPRRTWPEARLELAYGEWLLGQRRVAEAAEQLAAALDTFDRLGASAWSSRAREALDRVDGGDATEHGAPAARDLLSAQELRIARLAADGLSNRAISERLFLSPRTVGSHLYRIYPKLEITSRAQLAHRLGAPTRD